nr:unnamed protein product [Spirometra erinaceieuropaei]
MKQVYILAPNLFIFMLSVMLLVAYRDERPGISTAYRTEASFSTHVDRKRLRGLRLPVVMHNSPRTTVHSMPRRKQPCNEACGSSPPVARTSD